MVSIQTRIEGYTFVVEADKCDATDPKYEEEVSGCTASVGILTHEKIYVVRLYRHSEFAELGS